MNHDRIELPSYADWIIDGEIAAFSMPGREELRQLSDAGFGLIINLTERNSVTQAAGAFGMKAVHIPVKDMTAPSPEQIRDFVATVHAHVSRGVAVGVHCLGGVGRTGTMIACYLVNTGMDPWEAIDHVRRRRPGSVQTLSQERAIIEYAASLRATADGAGHGCDDD